MEPQAPYVAPPPPAPPAAAAATSRATTALVLAIVGLLCCPATSPLAWWMGAQELAAIRRGEAPIAGQAGAQISMVLGILGSVLLALSLLTVAGAAAMIAIGALFGR
jgi:hypothetical protein